MLAFVFVFLADDFILNSNTFKSLITHTGYPEYAHKWERSVKVSQRLHSGNQTGESRGRVLCVLLMLRYFSKKKKKNGSRRQVARPLQNQPRCAPSHSEAVCRQILATLAFSGVAKYTLQTLQPAQ